MEKQTKNIIQIIILIIILIIIYAITITLYDSPKLGGSISDGGTITRLTTGEDQVITSQPAFLRSIIFGNTGDTVVIGDSKTSASSNTNIYEVSGVAITIPIEGYYINGITATVTATNGATFIWSPR